jgi:Xaa-Pro aminopeptidase
MRGHQIVNLLSELEDQAAIVPLNGYGEAARGNRVKAYFRYWRESGWHKRLMPNMGNICNIGLHEAESPFFGPGSQDIIEPGMAVCIDVSFFGHPEHHGVRIETGYKITESGIRPFSDKMDRILTEA